MLTQLKMQRAGVKGNGAVQGLGNKELQKPCPRTALETYSVT